MRPRTRTDAGTRKTTIAHPYIMRAKSCSHNLPFMVAARLKNQTPCSLPRMVVEFLRRSGTKPAGQHRHRQLRKHHKDNRDKTCIRNKCRAKTSRILQLEATRSRAKRFCKRLSPSTTCTHTFQRTPSVQFANRVNHKIPKPAPRCMANQTIYPNLKSSVMP